MKKTILENKSLGIRIELPADMRYLMLIAKDLRSSICCHGYNEADGKFRGIIIDIRHIKDLRPTTEIETQMFKNHQKDVRKRLRKEEK